MSVSEANAVMAGVLLLATLRAQLRPLGRHRRLLDAFGIVPEWRFYARASLTGAADLARDIHLVVRDRDVAGRTGGWRPVLWHHERRLRHALLNPARRSDERILSLAEDLVEIAQRDGSPLIQQSLRYLVVLRRCLDAPCADAAMDARQFAIVRTIGQLDRTVSLDFVSAWHRP